MPAELSLLVLRQGFNRVPKYHRKRVPHPECDEWCSLVSIYHNDRLLATHIGQAFISTRVEAIADTAWDAITSICYTHCHELQGSWHEFYSRRRSGTEDFSVAMVGEFVSP